MVKEEGMGAGNLQSIKPVNISTVSISAEGWNRFPKIWRATVLSFLVLVAIDIIISINNNILSLQSPNAITNKRLDHTLCSAHAWCAQMYCQSAPSCPHVIFSTPTAAYAIEELSLRDDSWKEPMRSLPRAYARAHVCMPSPAPANSKCLAG